MLHFHAVSVSRVGLFGGQQLWFRASAGALWKARYQERSELGGLFSVAGFFPQPD